MTLNEIENLSFADLKTKRDELLAGLKEADHAELASRYVQARTDAKQRDEKLGEQGQTIAALQSGYQALERESAGTISDLRAQLEKAEGRANRLETMNVNIEERLTKAVEAEKANVAKLQADLAQETTRANAAEALAKNRRKGLADVAGIINPLLAAE